MKKWIAVLAATGLVVACSNIVTGPGSRGFESVALSPDTLEVIGQRLKGQLRPVGAFTNISDVDQRSAAIFTEMGEVLTHPRCVNCHPSTNSPLQGDKQVVHSPPVTRGPDGHGVFGMTCATCHGESNFVFEGGKTSLPGNPKWHLAPAEMAWEGKSIAEICHQIRDPARNGGMTLAQLQHHNAEDALVGYGWDPGPGREPAPGTQKQFGELTKAWIDAGAVCPTN